MAIDTRQGTMFAFDLAAKKITTSPIGMEFVVPDPPLLVVVLDFELPGAEAGQEILNYYVAAYDITFGSNAYAINSTYDPPNPGVHVCFRAADFDAFDNPAPQVEISLGARHTATQISFDYWASDPSGGMWVYMWNTNGLPNDGAYTGWTFLNTGGQGNFANTPPDNSWVVGQLGPTFAGNCDAITFVGDANKFTIDNLTITFTA
jgi:hypothetical protein